MSAALLNVAIGLLTSVLSGASVWLWQRGKSSRILRRKAALFGLAPDAPCLIVMTSRYDNPKTSSHHDIHAVVEVVALADELDCPASVRSSEEIRESNGDRTEICIGGPDSNPRTRGHLAAHLPGVTIHPFSAGNPDSIAIVVGDRWFRRDPGEREYVLVAKFKPGGASRPVLVICGQTAITNRAAIHLLKREHRQIANAVASLDRFCLVVRVEAMSTFGYQAASLDRDVTDIAFAAS